MTEREKMHACVLYNPNDETIMAERSESPSLSVKRFFFLSPAGSCRAPALPERSRAVPRCVFILSVSPSYRGTTRRPPLSKTFRKRPQCLFGFADTILKKQRGTEKLGSSLFIDPRGV